MSQLESKTCPICNETYDNNQVRKLQNGVTLRVNCERCGKYDIAKEFAVAKPWFEVRHLVSAWIRQQNNAGIKPVIPTDTGVDNAINHESWENRFRYMGFPETTSEKLDALLLAYAERVSSNYQERVKTDRPGLISTVAAKDIDEIKGLTNLLEEMGLLKKVEKAYGALTISAEGWLKIDELRKTNAASNTAFIAMWFSESTKQYREAVIRAVEFCGYRPIIVDQEDYSGFIMDQVISLLKQAKFVIADFTCRREEINNGKVQNGVRGGVYWESGMAYGLGKTLIHTCEDNPESRERIHFDVDQYNTIYWKQEELSTEIRSTDEPIENPVFAEKLAMRILALVGKGSYKAE